MEIAELIDIEKLSNRPTGEGRRAFDRWTATALEVCPDKREAITSLRTAYLGIPDAGLRASQFEAFVGALVDIMSTLEQKKTLLTAEALPEIIFGTRI